MLNSLHKWFSMDNQPSERDTREKKGQERERVKGRKKGGEKMRERGKKRNGNQKELFEIPLF